MKKWFTSLFTLLTVAALLFPHGIAYAQSAAGTVPAFPGAEGFGAYSLGGRGGRVFEVTNTNDSGAGSLRACVEASGPRTCIFRTGGTIVLNSALTISNPYITIAGQTAPGGGITLKKSAGGDALLIKTHDVVLRYITSRPGAGGENHAAQAASNGVHLYNIIIDHCSFSWGTDEVLETWYKVYDTTIQWSIVSEGLDCSTHSKGCHSKGLMVGGYADSESKNALGSEDISVHHNLFAHNGERNPLIQTSGLVDVVNNVAYDPFGTFMYVYMKSNSIVPVNFIGNFYKYGPETSSGKYEIKTYDDGGQGADLYVEGNIGPHRTADSQTQSLVVDSGSRGFLTTARHAAPLVTSTSATDAYAQVLAAAGNSAALACDGTWSTRRDGIDARVVNDVRNGTGKIIDDPSQVGGWETIAAGAPCADSDHDGMPDVWETRFGLNPNNATDNITDFDGDGYTNVEEYLNGTDPKNGAVATLFYDVPADYWAREWIERLYQSGITGGCGINPLMYCPEAQVTRGQMAVFLERAMHGSGYTPPTNVPITFNDTTSHWARYWIEALVADGVSAGCGNGNFCPDLALTRDQMAVFLLKGEHGIAYTPPPASGTQFDDVPADYWAAAWIEQLAAEGITGGCSSSSYCPGMSVTRAQMAVFLVRTFALP